MIMLVVLKNIPKTKEEWDRFSFHHRDSHNKIRKAIQTQKGINLTDFVLEPISSDNIQGFLDNNSQMHKDMNVALGTQGSDLQDVDLKNKEELEAWFDIHYTEHFDAESELKI